MSIKKDKKTVSAIMVITGILIFVLVMGIVIFSLPNTKVDENATHSTTQSETAIAQASETEAFTGAETDSGEETTPEVTAEETSAEEAATKETSQEETATEEPATEEITTEEPTTEETTTEETTAEPRENTVTLVAFGDNLLHKPIMDWSLADTGSYRLDECYSGIKKLVQSADISVINEEVPIGGIELGLHDYPQFNAVYEVADTLHDLGIDVLTTATNHALDVGPQGVANMLTYFRSNYSDMLITGTYFNSDERNQTPIYESNGIRIAMLNYTYGVNMGNSDGVVVNLLGDGNAVVADIKQAKRLSDFVVVFVHWGQEYYLVEDAIQQAWAQGIANAGADLIIGTHPHVVQSCQEITAYDGRKVLCYYSLGNLVSLQHRTEAMLGGIAKLTLVKDESGTHISEYDYDFIVTHWDSDHDHCRAVLWEDYTRELAAEHGMVGIDKSFSYDALSAIVESHRLIK